MSHVRATQVAGEEGLETMDYDQYTQVWIFLGNEEVRERQTEKGELARRRNKKAQDFTHFLTHKSTTLLSTTSSQMSLHIICQTRNNSHSNSIVKHTIECCDVPSADRDIR